MKFNQRRQLAQVALFSLMALGAGSAFAQAERPAPGLPSPSGQAGISISPAQFSTSLQARERELASIEQLFTRIEAAKLPEEKEKLSDELSQPLAAYAKGMIADFGTALKQAELGAKSQSKEGSTGLLKPFEDLAVKHEQRMKMLDERAQKIGRDIEKGEGEPKKSSFIAEPIEAVKVARGWPILEKISDFLISPAHALIAIPVVAACSQANPNSNPPPTAAQYAACQQAIQTANGLGAQAQTTFTSCWNSAHRHKLKRDGHIHFLFTMHTACTTALVARLA